MIYRTVKRQLKQTDTTAIKFRSFLHKMHKTGMLQLAHEQQLLATPDKNILWQVDLDGVYNIYSITIMFKQYDGYG